MRLCGISSRFQLLSPCTGQVTHALLTRPPLSLQNINSEEDQLSSFVRLACVKHAASVHPEPGSNSLIKCVWFGQNNYLAIHSLFTVFKGQFLKNKTFQEFSRLFHCSVIKVLKLFLCCLSTGATLISYHSFFSLSTTFFNFFYFSVLQFFDLLQQRVIYYHLFFILSTDFLNFFIFYFCSKVFLSFYVLSESFCAWFCEKIFCQLQSFLPSGKQSEDSHLFAACPTG